MATISIPYPFRPYTESKAEIAIEGTSVRETLQALYQQFPQLTPYLVDQNYELRHSLLVYLNGEDIRYLDGMETPVQENSVLKIIPALAGGKNETHVSY